MLTKLQQSIIAIVLFFSAIIGIWLRAKQEGKKQAEARTNEQILQNAQAAKDVEVEVDAMSDAAMRDELRRNWKRD